MRTSKNQQRKLNRRIKGQVGFWKGKADMYKAMHLANIKALQVLSDEAYQARSELRRFEKGLLTQDGLHLPTWVAPPCPIYFRLDDQKTGSGLILLPGGQ